VNTLQALDMLQHSHSTEGVKRTKHNLRCHLCSFPSIYY